MTIGAVIVTHNSKDYIGTCVIGLRHEGITNIVVVDSASTDTTLQDLKVLDVHVIVLSENRGFGYAANIGAQHMNTDYVLFINPDAYIDAGAVGRVQRLLAQTPKAGIVGMTLQDKQGVQELSGHGYEPTLIRLLFRKLVSWLHSVIPRRDRGIHVAFRADWVSGGAMVVDRKLFSHIGGFDEQFFLYWEDIDLCRRARKAGYSVWMHPQARAVHARGASHADMAVKTRIYDMSADKYYKKHYPTHIWLLQKIFRIIYRLFRPVVQ